MTGAPERDEVERRIEVLTDIQERIMDEYNRKCINKVFSVLCEGFDPIIRHYYGRTYADSPEIDGKVFFTSKSPVPEGEFADVLIEDILDGDLVGRALK